MGAELGGPTFELLDGASAFVLEAAEVVGGDAEAASDDLEGEALLESEGAELGDDAGGGG